jgi:hypothetical protein
VRTVKELMNTISACTCCIRELDRKSGTVCGELTLTCISVPLYLHNTTRTGQQSSLITCQMVDARFQEELDALVVTLEVS